MGAHFTFIFTYLYVYYTYMCTIILCALYLCVYYYFMHTILDKNGIFKFPATWSEDSCYLTSRPIRSMKITMKTIRPSTTPMTSPTPMSTTWNTRSTIAATVTGKPNRRWKFWVQMKIQNFRFVCDWPKRLIQNWCIMGIGDPLVLLEQEWDI